MLSHSLAKACPITFHSFRLNIDLVNSYIGIYV